jgi:hypothetical protein
MTDLTRVTELNAQLAAIKEQLKDLVKSAVTETAQEIFTKYPYLEAFSWKQSGPHFADGDISGFYVDSDNISLRIDGEHYNAYEDGDLSEEVQLETVVLTDELLDEIYGEISEVVGNMDEDTMQEAYGDDVEVWIARDGTVTFEEYHNY